MNDVENVKPPEDGQLVIPGGATAKDRPIPPSKRYKPTRLPGLRGAMEAARKRREWLATSLDIQLSRASHLISGRSLAQPWEIDRIVTLLSVDYEALRSPVDQPPPTATEDGDVDEAVKKFDGELSVTFTTPAGRKIAFSDSGPITTVNLQRMIDALLAMLGEETG